MSFYKRLLAPENLYYAWKKAKRMYRMHDGYIDRAEIAEFELNLEERLKDIRASLESGTYRTKKLLPVPRPKKIEGSETINRQYYHIAVEDQVAWLAVANALGPVLDNEMPPWSYGNRLYRPAWYQTEEQKSVLELGPYRHESGHLYRKFQHSWPLYRRHITLAAKTMVHQLNREELDRSDELAAAAADAERLPYLNKEFWNRESESNSTDLFFGSIDLKQFYPSLSAEVVLSNIVANIELDDVSFVTKLLKGMLSFQLDKSGVPSSAIGTVEPKFGGRQVKGLPTGLFVSGFLANAALLHVDRAVEDRLNVDRNVAHFRFVDDHTIIAYDFDSLCRWIKWYQEMVRLLCPGVEVNEKKFDPESLGEYLALESKSGANAQRTKVRQEKLRIRAMEETRIDGSNPTKLLTKTLGQVSAIAATNADILDDNDLRERLRLLEWLLLADIPDREIRSDTRAAFAAGQIARLAPILVQEADGLVDENRALELLKAVRPRDKSEEALKQQKAEILAQQFKVNGLQKEHDISEAQSLRRCFDLLMQAFTQYPSKSRLFYRMLQYCRLTGHRGLKDVEDWVTKTRASNRECWADYYCGLAHQILGDNIPKAVATLLNSSTLRSDQLAASRHLEDVVALNGAVLSVPFVREAWFHCVARRELALALLAGGEALAGHGNENIGDLGQRLKLTGQKFLDIPSGKVTWNWSEQTGREAGTWMHLFEETLSLKGRPSNMWSAWSPTIDYSQALNRIASRRYPEALPATAWRAHLETDLPAKEDDSGWIAEAVVSDLDRLADLQQSKRRAYNRAARSISKSKEGYMTVTEWTMFVRLECSPFDPRYSEWTSLEIVRQLLASRVNEASANDVFDRIHPENVLVPLSWKEKFKADLKYAPMSWEAWRHFIDGALRETTPTNQVVVTPAATSIMDYRYYSFTQGALETNKWEQQLTAFARLLLGLLSLRHEGPRIWNMRGNEEVIAMPLQVIFQSLAISSPTLLLLEGCLSGRSAENRYMARQPELFGWDDQMQDFRFDPPHLRDPDELLEAIKAAQTVLEDNQLAVSRNQPRQLIPFRLKDFDMGAPEESPEDLHAEG